MPLRVLLAHNAYRSGTPSGENASVREIEAALRAGGAEVVTYHRSSDEVAGMRGRERLAVAVRPVWNPGTGAELVRLARRHAVDLVHLENANPLIGLDVLRTLRRAGIPTSKAIRNFRPTCLAGTRVRDGAPCRLCRPGHPAWGVVHGCYQGSRLASVPLAVATARHGAGDAGAFLVASAFMRRYAVEELWIPPERVVLRPNVAPPPASRPSPLDDEPVARRVLFVGRLDQAKGVDVLLAAWRRRDPGPWSLWFVGDGPLRGAVERAAEVDPTVRWLAPQPLEQVRALLRSSALAVVPSVFPEPFGRVAVEALAEGCPVLVSDRGALPELAAEGACWVCPPTPGDLAGALRVLLRSDLRARRATARALYAERFGPWEDSRATVEVFADLTRAARSG